jgi:hypothetical protein
MADRAFRPELHFRREQIYLEYLHGKPIDDDKAIQDFRVGA